MSPTHEERSSSPRVHFWSVEFRPWFIPAAIVLAVIIYFAADRLVVTEEEWLAAPAPGFMRMSDARRAERIADEFLAGDLSVAEGLAGCGPAGIRKLIAALGHEDGRIAHTAQEVLGRAGEEALEPLLRALRHDDPMVAARAARALGRMHDQRAVEPLVGELRRRIARHDPEAVATVEPPADSQIVMAPHEYNPTELPIGAMAEALGDIQDPRARVVLEEVMALDAPGASSAAAKAITWLLPPGETVPTQLPADRSARDRSTLLSALRHSSEGVRAEALRGLGELADPTTLDEMVAMLHDPAYSVRSAAASALGDLGDARAVAPLLALLDDEERRVNADVNAIIALGEIGDARAVPYLIGLLEEDGPTRPARAAQALGRIGDPRAVEPLIAALADCNEWAVDEIVIALGELGDARAVEVLVPLLKHGDTDVVEATAEALRKIGDERAVEPLIALARADLRGASGAAIEALGAIGDPRGVEVMIEALGARSRDERSRAAWEALPAMGETAVPALIEALGAEDSITRESAQHLLMEIGEPARPALEKAAAGAGAGAAGAKQVLGRMAQEEEGAP